MADESKAHEEKKPRPEATDASGHPWVRSIRAAVPDAVVSAKEFAGQVTVVVAKDAIARVARHLKDGEDFKYCVDVTAVDWKDRQPRFDVVYHFYSFSKNDRIRVKCGAADGEEVPSIATVFLAANWCERETYDMFGIVFAGHPDLSRILMPDDWEGHPQRKDYPLGGIPVEYKGAEIPPPDERRSYS